MSTTDDLVRALGPALHRPGDDAYTTATSPRNATARQHPLAVVAATSAEDVRRAVRAAHEAGLGVVVQATGHGAAGTVGDDVLLVDTSRLTSISIDPATRTARVGAGTTWAALNAAAEPYGLLGLAGTAPDVGVVGYTVLGGVGWLTRPFGMASATLRRVELVDGAGEQRVVDEEQDPDALGAFRGAGGAGVVTAVELDLVGVDDLWAGYALWPATEAGPVVRAWAAATATVDDSVSSAIGLLSAPDAPTVPEQLRGHRVVHLAAASVRGAAGFAPLREAFASAPAPAIDTFGPCDAERLGRIHLDPPAAVPGFGEGRWLTAAAPDVALDVLGAHGFGDDAPLSEIEIRHVCTSAGTEVPGALTTVPGPFLLHAVGPAPTPDDQPRVEAALGVVRARAEPVDTGRASTSFRDGRTTAPGALRPEEHERLAAVRRRLDPYGVVRQPRPL